MRQRNQRIETNRKQRLDFSVMNGVHNLLRRVACAGDVIRTDPPYFRDVRPSCRILDRARAWKLITLLAMFAPALTIALAGDHRTAAALSAEFSRSQCQIDQRQHILNTLGLMLKTAGMHR